MKRDFEEWFKTLKDTVAGWNYYTDFNKVYNNVENLKVELNILNSLIGSNNIEKDFKELVNKYPEVLNVIPILMAIRHDKVKINDKGKLKEFNFKNPNYSIDEYCEFMKKTGLFELFKKHITNNLLDYVKGVEVGLDTNARKNRTGTAMEDLVEEFLIEAGLVKDKTYFKEMRTSEILNRFGIDLNKFNKQKRAEKRYDFVVKTKNILYVIEVNFYSSSGSKLNETARSYKMLAQESKDLQGVEFMWITDGFGWNSAKNNLKETFQKLEHLYNINDLENNIFPLLFIKGEIL